MSEDPTSPAAVEAGPARAAGSFLGSRWRAEVPLARVLWRDMLLVGTAVNVAAGFAGLLLFTSDLPTALAAGVYFAPLPYNVFLLIAVWRAADRAGEPPLAIARLVAVAWLVAAMLI